MITILGKSESEISMIADNIESHNSALDLIIVINNLHIPDILPYKSHRFIWEEYDSVQNNHTDFLIGASRPATREKIFNIFKIKMGKFINCIHQSAQISSTSTLGKGVIVNSLVSISSYSLIGDFVWINRNASVGHHSEVGDFVTIAPSATICGKVKIGRGTFIGAGAIIKDGISIGADCLIGAGSVVVKDVPSDSIGYGNPFKVAKKKK